MDRNAPNQTIPLTRLGSMPVAQFIAEYWHKKPLLIRNAFADRVPIVPADELAGLACEAEVESRLLIENPPTGDWTLRQGPFNAEDFALLPAQHWTLLVQAVDHWVPEAADFVQQFSFIPSWRLDDLMISYASTGGGVGPHYDNYDVFLVQGQGRRRWEVGGYYDESSPLVPNKPVRILSDWQPEQSWVLNPGDMLYLPPRIGHNGVAVSDDCLTYSVGYRAPQAGDMLMQFARYCSQRSQEEDRYADADLQPRLSGARIEPADLARVQAIMQRYLNDPDYLRDWFGLAVTESKYGESPACEAGEQAFPDVSQPVADALLQALSAAERVRRSEGVRFAYHQSAEALRLYVDGSTYRCSQEVLSLLILLCDHNDYAPESLLDGLAQPEGLRVLAGLFSADWLYTL